MKRSLPTWVIFTVVVGTASVLGGCQTIERIKAPANPPPAEPMREFVVLTYPLPFAYDPNQPRQKAFLYALQTMVAPADWDEGPDTMTPIAHMLVVSTTAENHLRLKRFFDSLPERPEGAEDVWTGGPAYEEPEKGSSAPAGKVP